MELTIRQSNLLPLWKKNIFKNNIYNGSELYRNCNYTKYQLLGFFFKISNIIFLASRKNISCQLRKQRKTKRLILCARKRSIKCFCSFWESNQNFFLDLYLFIVWDENATSFNCYIVPWEYLKGKKCKEIYRKLD